MVRITYRVYREGEFSTKVFLEDIGDFNRLLHHHVTNVYMYISVEGTDFEIPIISDGLILTSATNNKQLIIDVANNPDLITPEIISRLGILRVNNDG